MALTIIHKSSKELGMIISNLYQRKQTLQQLQFGIITPKTQQTIMEIRKYCRDIVRERYIRTIIKSSIWSEVQPIFNIMNKKYYASHQWAMICNIINTLWSFDYTKSADLTDLHSSKHDEFSLLPKTIWTMVFVQAWTMLESVRCALRHTSFKKIICLNTSTEQSIFAHQVLEIQKLNNITIQTTPATQFNYKDVDYVYIPNIANNKNQILAQIARTKNTAIHVYIQHALWLSRLFYENYTQTFFKYFERIHRKNISRKFSQRELHVLKGL